MGIEIQTPVQIAREQQAKQVSDANARLAELKQAYETSPEMRLQGDREQLQKLQSDPFHLNKKIGGSTAAQAEEQALVSRIAVAESRAEAARVAAAVAGEPIDLPGMIETTVNGQLPMRELISAVEPLLDRGVRPELLKSFLQHGRGDHPQETREVEIAAAKVWRQKLESDPVMQAKLLASDPEILRQLACYGGYAAAPHET
jgi:hypothetical protein